ncbi:hypothetical protein N7490_000357 [Penicillium lividum]|nr:hypothetical protein N7490_000357 [Penicillium lividum]
MRRTVDLGQCLLHSSESQLQLHFAATAKLNCLTSFPTETEKSSPQWLDPLSTWIREAPELELCFFVCFGSRLEGNGSHFISKLESMLCDSKVWLQLGFAIFPKRHGISMNTDHPGEHFLVLGLCRGMIAPFSRKRGSLPAVLHNPPDTHPPQEVPIVCLAAINIFLECSSSLHLDDQTLEPFITVHTEKEPQYLASRLASCPDPTDLTLDSEAFTALMEGYSIHQEEDTNQSSQSLLALVDFGLQKLLSSAPTKCSFIQVIENNIQSLRKLAPVIFNREYREAMNQRAISCPIIAKAVNSMLANTSNPILQTELSHIPGDRKQWIESGLWRMAQTRLRELKASKKCGSFLSQCSMISTAQTNGESAVAVSFTADVFNGGDILDFDDDWNLDNGNANGEFDDCLQTTHADFNGESDGPLLGSSSESSFWDLYESTQTTQTTVDNFPISETFSPLSDTDMLLFDCDLG